MTITILAKKGGVGKNTVCLLLHEAFRHAGKTVRVLDWDSQGTSSKALRHIGGSNAALESHDEVLLYDTPPSLEHPATAAAVLSSDVAVVVTSPSPADMWEAEEAIRFVQSKAPQAVVRVLVNKVKKGTILGRLITESTKDLGASIIPITLSSRECYQHVLGQGWAALDATAREEVLQLAVSLIGLSNMTACARYAQPCGSRLVALRLRHSNRRATVNGRRHIPSMCDHWRGSGRVTERDAERVPRRLE
jgi:chromosome partitioning protein